MNEAIPSVERLIARTRELASLPEVVMRAIDLINDPGSSAADIGNVIREDPALTARLLKIVNSPFYGFPSRIETVSRAITVVGTLELLDLILAASVVKAFSGIPAELVSMDDFWEHSLHVGCVARVLATRHRAPNPERYFVAGLLHDVGALVLYRQLPGVAATVLTRARERGEVLHEVERELLGYDHGEAGAALMQAWHLPESFATAIRYHHFPLEAPAHRLETALVHLADVASCAVRSAAAESGRVPPLAEGAWELVGLSPDIVESVLAEADLQYEDARAAILGSISAA